MNPALGRDADLTRYGLRVKPFQSGTDPTLLWLGSAQRETLGRLKAGILDGAGVLLLTGDVGTGKSLLAKALLESLGPQVLRATLTYARVEPLEFLNEIGDAWGIGGRHATREAFYARLEPFLAAAAAQTRRVLLLIDEAQTLSAELFVEIGHLASLVGEAGHARVGPSILLIGLPELSAMLSKPENAALQTRLRVECTAVPLRDDEVREYVSHRLRVAGADRPLFTTDGFREIAVCSQGIPRLIDVVADLALIDGARRNAPTIDAAIVRDCARRLEQPLDVVDRSGERGDGRARGASARLTLAGQGRRAGEAIRRLGRRQRPGGRPEPASEGEAGRPAPPGEDRGAVPPVADAPAPAAPGTAADGADGREPGEGAQRRYRLLGPPVGAPGGQVYAAEHLATGRRVVLHALRGAAVEDPTVLARLRRRAELAVAVARISPHVLAVEDPGRLDRSRLFVVTERLEGSSLEDLLREEGVLPLTRVLSLAVQIGEGLEAAHDLGLFHGRLDGSRVMVTDPPERAVLTGWEGDVGPALAATVPGVADDWPEPKVPRQQQDLLAFAALLYQMLAGVAPFSDDGPDDSRRRPRSLRKLRREVPGKLARLVMSGLDRRASRRPDLGSLLNALRLELTRLPSRDVRSDRPRRWRIAVGIALSAAAVLAALTWWTAEARRFRSVMAPSTAERPTLQPPAPDPVIRQPGPQGPTAEPVRPVEREPIPVPAPAADPTFPPLRVAPVRAVAPSPPPRVPPARAVAESPVHPQAPPPPDSAAARPAKAAAPVESGERDGEPDPAAIIDWLLRSR